MLRQLTFENPLAWVHFRLKLGWRTILSTTFLYAAIIVGLIFMSLRADPSDAQNIMYFWTQALMGLQCGVMLLFAGSAIRNAIRKDYTTHMIESHRLMPVPATQAVVGYITGGSVQALSLATVTFLLGVMTAAAAGLSLNDWILANAILALFAVEIWFAVAFLSFLTPAALGLVIGGMVACIVSSRTALVLLPAISIFTGPLIGKTIFGIIDTGSSWDWGYQVSTLAQLTFAGFCFYGAVRKYKRDDQVAFPPQIGLLLVIGWVTASVIGIRYHDDVKLTMGPSILIEVGTQVISSILAGMLLAIISVATAAWLCAVDAARRSAGETLSRDRQLPPEALALIAAGLLVLLPLQAGLSEKGAYGLPTAGPAALFAEMAPRLACTYLIAATFLLQIAALFRVFYRMQTPPTAIMAAWLLGSWLLPLLIDFVIYVASGSEKPEVLTLISTASPLGAMILLWTQGARDVLIGIGVQILLTAGLYLLVQRIRPRLVAA